LIIGSEPVNMGAVVEARVIGMLNMIDSGEADAKILAVQAKNPRFDTIKDLKDIEQFNPHLLKEVAHFFEHYKDLQGKKVETQGWKDAAAAKAEIKKAQEVYSKEK
jgi:inorganic pyrophosphatase